jgi:hypothetical protein
MTSYYEMRIKQPNPILDSGLLDTPGFSREVTQDILHNRVVKIDSLRNLNDKKLMHLSWVFDINFPITMSCIRERQYLENLIATLPQNEIMSSIHETIEKYLENRKSIQI